MNDALRELQAGLPIATERQSVEHFLHRWLDMIKPTIEESAWVRHRHYCELHIIPRIGRLKLTSSAMTATTGDIRRTQSFHVVVALRRTKVATNATTEPSARSAAPMWKRP
jgi:hypothetical protein